MKQFLLALIALVCVCAPVWAAESVPYLHGFFHNSPVTEVADSRSIKDLLKLDQPYFVYFYTNHSAHCKELVKPLIEVAKQVDPYVGVLAVDAANHKNAGVIHYYEVDEFPKLMFYRHGSLVPPLHYDEGPEVNVMVTWLREQIKPALELASSAANIYEHDEAQVVVYLDTQRPTFQKEIVQLADILHHHHELRVIEVTDPKVAAELGLNKAPTMALFRAPDHHDAAHALIHEDLHHLPPHNLNTNEHHPPAGPTTAAATSAPSAGATAAPTTAPPHVSKRAPTASFDLSRPHNLRQLREWIALNQLPLLGVITHKNFHVYIETDLPMFWLFTNDTTPGATWNDFHHSLLPLADKYRGRVVFVSGHDYPDHMKKLHLSGHHFPSAVLVVHKAALATTHLSDPKKYPMDETIPAERLVAAMEQHLDAYFGNKLRPHLLSLPVPHDEIPEDPVKTVVGSTFDQLILKNTNDVVLMFFSPWGEHSDWFQPIYEEFAAQMEPVTNLKFFKMDGTQNDWPRALFPCKGYPAIFFFKHTKTKPIQYHGNLTAPLIHQFIDHHSTATKQQLAAAIPFEQDVQEILHHIDTQGTWSIFRSDAGDFAKNVHRLMKEFKRRFTAMGETTNEHHNFMREHQKTGTDGLGDHDHPLQLSAHPRFESTLGKNLEDEAGELDYDHTEDDSAYQHSADHAADADQKEEAHQEMDYFDETHEDDDHLGEHEGEEDEDEHEHEGEDHHAENSPDHEEHHDYGQHTGEYDTHEIEGDHDDHYEP